MHLRLRQFGAACVLALAISSVSHAQQDEEKTPLGKKMSAMNAAFKAVGRQIDDASKNANTLEQLAIIETNAKAAVTMEPEKQSKVPAGTVTVSLPTMRYSVSFVMRINGGTFGGYTR